MIVTTVDVNKSFALIMKNTTKKCHVLHARRVIFLTNCDTALACSLRVDKSKNYNAFGRDGLHWFIPCYECRKLAS